MPKFCIIVLVIIVLFISCGEQNENIHNAHSGQENIFYTCSMDPQVKENKPGKCPICHMDLTPIRNDETETNELKLSNQQIYLGNITTQTFSTTSVTLLSFEAKRSSIAKPAQ